MTETPDDTMLARLFAEARSETPAASEAFLSRVLADAETIAARPSRPAPARRRGLLGAFVSALAGGWAGLGGLAAATAAGLWIGLAPPSALQRIAPGLYSNTVSVPFSLDPSALLPEGDA